MVSSRSLFFISIAVVICSSCAYFAMAAAAHPKGTSEDTWYDTELTTNLWRVVSSGNVEELRDIIQSDPESVHVRSSDGRGPLFWAYEYDQKEMIDMLVEAGASNEEKDGDGKRPSDVTKVGPTEYARRLEEENAQQKYNAEYDVPMDDDEE